ncbi:MAG: hypothetical protein ACE5F1_05205 [Planctomycetota bacterium]
MAAALTSACGSPEQRSVLRLVQLQPPEGSLLFLNQEIDLVFDGPVDPSSVTRNTVRILDENGLPVPGRRRVGTFTITFEPVPPTDTGLANGSFRPGQKYSLVLSHFPLSQSVRGAGGEVLLRARRRSWTVVRPDALPEGFSSPFLPSKKEYGSFLLSTPIRVGPNADWLELSFERPVFPPSARPGAFEVWSELGSERKPIRRVEVLPRAGAGGFGSILRLRFGQALAPGPYTLFFYPGSLGVQDYALHPLVVIVSKPGPDGRLRLEPEDRGAKLEFYVRRGSVSGPVRASFQSARPPFDGREIREEGLGVDPDGALTWGPDGLFWPQLGFADFDSLGDLEPRSNLRLEEGSAVELTPGRTLALPERSWDFDRFVIPRGIRCFLILNQPRALRIRVSGRFEVNGQLLVRLGSGLPLELPEPDGASIRRGDPLERWGTVLPRVEFEIGGICHLQGRITRDSLRPSGRAHADVVPGFLRGRGPFFGPWKREARIELWQKEDRPGLAGQLLEPSYLPGTWAVLSPWYVPDHAENLHGTIRWEERAGGAYPRILIQGRRASPLGPTLTYWAATPDQIAGLGKLSELRFAILLEGSEARPGRLARALVIR